MGVPNNNQHYASSHVNKVLGIHALSPLVCYALSDTITFFTTGMAQEDDADNDVEATSVDVLDNNMTTAFKGKSNSGRRNRGC
jgi:hypothetical protein